MASPARQLLKEAIGELALSAKKALLDESNDYLVRYAFGYPDTSAIGTGLSWPTDPGRWHSGFRDMMYFEQENGRWKPIRLTAQGYRHLTTIRTDNYASTGYSAGSYADLGIKRITAEQEALGNEVYVRPCNYYRNFTHSVPGVHGCWSWSGEDFQIWVRPKGSKCE